MKDRTDLIKRFMTVAPHSSGFRESLASAHALMRNYGLRHLPVLDGTKLVGIVSERDLYLIETLRDVNPEDVRVEEAMTVRTYCVSPETSLEEVAGEMAEHKYGCALVLEGGAVVGMFTTVDALRVLVHLLHRAPPPSPE